ncbi:MAG: M23 family metallopeptidase, partial [Chloroflexota bacterium]
KDKLSLNIEPPKEVENLRYNEMQEKPFSVSAGQSVTLNNVTGNILEMDLIIDPGLAKRFGLLTEQIIAAEVLPPADELIPPGTLLLVPKPAANDVRSPSNQIIPDCEFVDGPTAIGFNAQDYVNKQHGYLANHLIDSGSEGKSAGAQAIERIALDNSLSPRVILAIIEWESHWVKSQPIAPPETEYPLGFFDYHYRGLFRQLMWATATLSAGYYNWRSGALNELVFTDGTKLRLSPYLNAGSVAIQYYFSKTHTRAEWNKIIAPSGFAALYEGMFGPTWERAQYYEPTLTYGLVQPELSLPFTIGHVWAFTGGPHAAWEEDGAPAALDFAPSAQKNGCVINDAWVLAPAAGKVVRVGNGLVMLDLDGDGLEQTGWVLMFMHIRSDDKVELGQVLQKDDPIGHASCEGGVATGTHIHIARKYNGEWILADGPLAFNLDGWIAHNGSGPYKGSLTRNGQTIKACTCSTFETNIIREK